MGPQGGALFKRGLQSVEASVGSSDGDLPVVEVKAYRDGHGFPCVRVRARVSGGPERLFYDGPLEGLFPPEPQEPATPVRSPSPLPSDDYDCLDCQDLGWAVFNASPEDGYLGEIQACDCGFFPSDDEALAAARAAGLSVDDAYQVLFVPFPPY
jgi:hypothetical protein